MTKKERALEIVKACDTSGFATIAAGAFLETSTSMIDQQKTWGDGDGAKGVDFARYPYWITTDDGQMPVGITGADDTDLLDIIAQM